jgi:hypothetical protein
MLVLGLCVFDIKLGYAYNRHVLVIKFIAMKAYYSFLPI